jgi:hypothetical protein
MTRIRLTLSGILISLICIIFVSTAQAQATRTFVSGVGNDADPCSRTAPCRTFAGALIKTAINGEINALDPGGYGTVNITKSITIDGTYGSGFGSTLASGTTGVIINIPVGVNDPHRRVTLRRLSINGTGPSGAVGTNTGTRGISATTNGFAHLYVEDCDIQNFSTAGIRSDFAPPVTGSRMTVRNTRITNINGVASATGIEINATSNFITVVLDGVTIDRAATGVNSRDRVFLQMRDAFVHNCSTAGIAVNAPSNQNDLKLERTVLFSVNTGIAAGNAGTRVIISNTTITGNSNAATSAGALLESHGNNRINHNTAAGAAFANIGES